jgi:hypothetical protein
MKAIFLLVIFVGIIIFFSINATATSDISELSLREKEQLCRAKYYELLNKYEFLKTQNTQDLTKYESLFFEIDRYSTDYKAGCLNRNESGYFEPNYWTMRLNLLSVTVYFDVLALSSNINVQDSYYNFVFPTLERIILFTSKSPDVVEQSIRSRIKRTIGNTFENLIAILKNERTLNEDDAESIFQENELFNELRKSSVLLYLNSLYKLGDCTNYLGFYLTEKKFITREYEQEVINYLDDIFIKCENSIIDDSYKLTNLRGESFKTFYQENSLFRDFLSSNSVFEILSEQKKIDVYFYNDYGLSEDEFEKRVMSFKKVVLDEATSYEFLGSDKNADKPKLNFIAKYIEQEAFQCNELDSKIDSCVCNETIFDINALRDGADVYLIITPQECRSWARPGKNSAISWPKFYDKSSANVIETIQNFFNKYDNLKEYMILHELGHLIWALPDEYIEEERRLTTRFPNCAEYGHAILWWHELKGNHEQYASPLYGLVDYFEGCGYHPTNVYRPTKLSIMRTHFHFAKKPTKTPVFGPVSDFYIKKYMDLSEDLPVDNYYASLGHIIEISNDEDNLDHLHLGTTFLSPRRNLLSGLNIFNEDYSQSINDVYSWELYSVYDTLIRSEEFTFSREIFISRDPYCVDENATEYIEDCDDMPSVLEINDSKVILGVPHHDFAQKLQIKNPIGEVVLSIDLSEHSNFCGDGICSIAESFYTCPLDCEEEILIYGFINGKQRDFYIYRGTISGTGQVDIVYKQDGCMASSNNCVELIENEDKINIFVKSHGDIFIYNSDIYDINVKYTTGTGNLFFETKTSKLLITPTEIKTSYSIWEDLPKITRTTYDNNCKYIFDVDSTEKLFLNCENN